MAITAAIRNTIHLIFNFMLVDFRDPDNKKNMSMSAI